MTPTSSQIKCVHQDEHDSPHLILTLNADQQFDLESIELGGFKELESIPVLRQNLGMKLSDPWPRVTSFLLAIWCVESSWEGDSPPYLDEHDVLPNKLSIKSIYRSLRSGGPTTFDLFGGGKIPWKQYVSEARLLFAIPDNAGDEPFNFFFHRKRNGKIYASFDSPHPTVVLRVISAGKLTEPDIATRKLIENRWFGGELSIPYRAAHSSCKLFQDSDAAYDDIRRVTKNIKNGKATVIQLSCFKARPIIDHLLNQEFNIELYLSDKSHRNEDVSKGLDEAIRYYQGYQAIIHSSADQFHGELCIHLYPFESRSLRLIWIHGYGVYFGHYRVRKEFPQFLAWGHEDPMFFVAESDPSFHALKNQIRQTIQEDFRCSEEPALRFTDCLKKIAQSE